jgi:hypothetical protein
MARRSICGFLAIKERSVQAIHGEFAAVVGMDAVASPTITKHRQQ